MSLIKCCECGNQVSDRAAVCPHCGFPIANISSNSEGTNGIVRIKLEPTPKVISQKVTISGCGASWRGTTGQVAEFCIHKAGQIKILYHSTLSVGDGECTATVSPTSSNIFVVRPRPVFARLRTKLDIQRVDIIT